MKPEMRIMSHELQPNLGGKTSRLFKTIGAPFLALLLTGCLEDNRKYNPAQNTQDQRPQMEVVDLESNEAAAMLSQAAHDYCLAHGAVPHRMFIEAKVVWSGSNNFTATLTYLDLNSDTKEHLSVPITTTDITLDRQGAWSIVRGYIDTTLIPYRDQVSANK